MRGDEWIEEQGLILFGGKVYVRNSERKLCAYIITCIQDAAGASNEELLVARNF